MPSIFLVQAEYLPQWKLISYFQGDKGGSQCPSCTVSQVHLIQNNQYSKVAYSGVIYSEPLYTKDGNAIPWAKSALKEPQG